MTDRELRRALVNTIELHREAIITDQYQWLLSTSGAARERYSETRSIMYQIGHVILDALAERIEHPSLAAFQFYNLDLVTVYDFSQIDYLVHVLLQYEDSIFPYYRRDYPSDLAAMEQAQGILHAAVRQHTAEHVDWIVQRFSRQLQEEQQRTATLLEMARVVGGTLDLDSVLHSIVLGVASALEAPHCVLYTVNSERNALVRRAGATGDSIPGREITLGPGGSQWLQAVLEKNGLYVCSDTQTDPRTKEDDWVQSAGLKSVLVLPIAISGELEAVVIAFSLEEICEFDQNQIDLAQGIADVAGPAVANARLHNQVKQLTVVEERIRLAQEMHDSVSQVFGTINLRVASAQRMLKNGQVEKVDERLRELKKLAEQGYADTRGSIINLRSAASPGPSLEAELQNVLSYCGKYLGLAVETNATADHLPQFPVEVRLQVIRIVQEALMNVHKHARSKKACVFWEWKDDWFRISVRDDGLGFDARHVEEEGFGHFGIKTMRERTAAIGGELEVDSQPGRGTRVMLCIPAIGCPSR